MWGRGTSSWAISACDTQVVCNEEVIIRRFFANFVAYVVMVACEEPLPKHLVTHLPKPVDGSRKEQV